MMPAPGRHHARPMIIATWLTLLFFVTALLFRPLHDFAPLYPLFVAVFYGVLAVSMLGWLYAVRHLAAVFGGVPVAIGHVIVMLVATLVDVSIELVPWDDTWHGAIYESGMEAAIRLFIVVGSLFWLCAGITVAIIGGKKGFRWLRKRRPSG